MLNLHLLEHLGIPACLAIGSRLQTSQTEDERGTQSQRIREACHLNRPTAIHHETCLDDCADQGFPRIGMFVRENDDQTPVGLQGLVARTEGPRHAFFVIPLEASLSPPKRDASSINSPSLRSWLHRPSRLENTASMAARGRSESGVTRRRRNPSDPSTDRVVIRRIGHDNIEGVVYRRWPTGLLRVASPEPRPEIRIAEGRQYAVGALQ